VVTGALLCQTGSWIAFSGIKQGYSMSPDPPLEINLGFLGASGCNLYFENNLRKYLLSIFACQGMDEFIPGKIICLINHLSRDLIISSYSMIMSG